MPLSRPAWLTTSIFSQGARRRAGLSEGVEELVGLQAGPDNVGTAKQRI